MAIPPPFIGVNMFNNDLVLGAHQEFLPYRISRAGKRLFAAEGCSPRSCQMVMNSAFVMPLAPQPSPSGQSAAFLPVLVLILLR